MNLYSFELFVHVTGVVIVFGGYGALLFGASALRLARTTEEVRAITRIIAGRKIGFEYVSVVDVVVIVGAALLVVTGLTMATSTWGLGRAWIEVSIATVVAIGLAGAFVLGPRLHRIDVAARQAPDGPLPESLRVLIRDPICAVTLYAATAALVGVLFLMTNKPSLSISVVAVAFPAALGVAAGLMPSRA